MNDLIDAILRHGLELQRLSQGEEAKADAILRELEQELRALLNSRELSTANRREINAIIKAADEAIAAKYVNAAGIVDVEAIAQHVAERTVEAMETGFGATMAMPSTLKSLTMDILIYGSPSSKWWAKQSEDVAFKFAGHVRRGVLNGETNERIVRRVVGGRGEVGLLDVSRRNARALVHSSIMTAANQARLETYRKNARYARGVKVLETLDSHTCIQCMAYDGTEWDFDGKPLNEQARKLNFNLPTYHWNCRGVISPLPMSFDALGLEGFDAKLAKIGARASSQGPVASGTSFTEFLKRQPPEFVNDVLGAKRAKRYLKGELTLTDLVTKEGTPLTLDQLKAR